MKAELKGIYSPDTDLADSSAELPTDTLLVQLMIGPENAPGEESFDVLVCTPEWNVRTSDSRRPETNEHTLVLDRIDIALVRRYVNDFLRDLERPTWQELATEISRVGKWEFQDYRRYSEETE
ncbi:Imm8 family immunity protein [Nocardia sp. NPDC049190]|uniref:Imm8 family immunity protein n=1 Tax=Nocardia sp. NPDC049190 TaxID=3155650 RepID=UPI0033FDA467